MPKREYLMLLHKFNKQPLNDWLVSEKLDGIRCCWDGGISRGLLASEVPYANTAKDSRYLRPLRASGLWTRYGKPIQAPSSFLDALPPIAIDGELWLGYDKFQELSSIVKQLDPDPEDWKAVTFNAFNVPFLQYWLADGRIYNPNMDITLKGAAGWAFQRSDALTIRYLKSAQNFRNAQKIIQQYPENANFKHVKQHKLSACSIQARKEAYQFFDKVTDHSGEGVVFSNPNGYWMPERSYNCLKLKGIEESEATVTGYIFGSETDKGSKLLGTIGSLIVDWNGKRFCLSGLNTDERYLNDYQFAADHPEQEAPEHISSDVFPRGSKVTFTYRSLTKEGLPKEARYKRKRDYE